MGDLEKFAVLKFTTHDDLIFHMKIPHSMRDVKRVDIVEMTKEEYHNIPITGAAVDFLKPVT